MAGSIGPRTIVDLSTAWNGTALVITVTASDGTLWQLIGTTWTQLTSLPTS